MARNQRRRPSRWTCAWEYQEFRIPESDHVQTLFGWLREGWEFVGFHRKTLTTQEQIPVVIMRRERELAPLTVAG